MIHLRLALRQFASTCGFTATATVPATAPPHPGTLSGLDMLNVTGGTFTMGGHDDVDDGGLPDADGRKFDARALRGGTWSNDAHPVRTRDRNGSDADLRLPTLGFRLAQ